jgi:hypothetical protein
VIRSRNRAHELETTLSFVPTDWVHCENAAPPTPAVGLGRVKTIFGRPDAFGLRQDRPQEPF